MIQRLEYYILKTIRMKNFTIVNYSYQNHLLFLVVLKDSILYSNIQYSSVDL